MPYRFLPLVDPVVRHGLWELGTGAPISHVLWQVALTSALVGAGMTPDQALRVVEAHEPALLGFHPGEPLEPYHRGYVPPGVAQPYPGGYPR